MPWASPFLDEVCRATRVQAEVRAEGFEPPRLSPPVPKTGVYPSSTTPAGAAILGLRTDEGVEEGDARPVARSRYRGAVISSSGCPACRSGRRRSVDIIGGCSRDAALHLVVGKAVPQRPRLDVSSVRCPTMFANADGETLRCARVRGSISIGREPVSKTGDSRFESWLPRLTDAGDYARSCTSTLNPSSRAASTIARPWSCPSIWSTSWIAVSRTCRSTPSRR